MSTGLNDPNKCRWCGMFHSSMCPTVKAIEFHADGITVKRVEFKDYYLEVPATPKPITLPDAPAGMSGNELQARLDMLRGS